MRVFGYAMVAVGILAGALVSSLDVEEIPWTWYGASIALAVVGVAVARSATRQQLASPERLAAHLTDLTESIATLADGVARVGDELEDEAVYSLPETIDERFGDPILRFVEARESIIQLYDIQTYASVMSEFAAGERYLNRVWSAAAEGYIDEVRAYLSKSAERFTAARELLAARATA